MSTPITFGSIVPDRLYDTPVVSSLFGVCDETVRNWVASGRLRCVPRARADRYRFFGSEILRLLGCTATEIPAASETTSGRRERAARDRAEIRRLAKGRP